MALMVAFFVSISGRWKYVIFRIRERKGHDYGELPSCSEGNVHLMRMGMHSSSAGSTSDHSPSFLAGCMSAGCLRPYYDGWRLGPYAAGTFPPAGGLCGCQEWSSVTYPHDR